MRTHKGASRIDRLAAELARRDGRGADRAAASAPTVPWKGRIGDCDDGRPVAFSIGGRPRERPARGGRSLGLADDGAAFAVHPPVDGLGSSERTVPPLTPTIAQLAPTDPTLSPPGPALSSRPAEPPLPGAPTSAAPGAGAAAPSAIRVAVQAPNGAGPPTQTLAAGSNEPAGGSAPRRAPRPDDDTFQDDLLHILGAHRPDPASPPVPQPSDDRAGPDPRRQPGDAEPLAAAQSHAIFDRLGQQFSLATTYDLGPVALQHRLDQFDRVIDAERDEVTAREAQARRRNALAAQDEAMDIADLTARTAAQRPEPAPPVRRVVHDAGLVRAAPGLSCWAAAAATLVAWRDRLAASSDDVVAGAGPWAAYADVRSARSVADLTRWGLTITTAPQSVARFVDALDTHGPLVVAANPPGAHAVVVSAATTDGTAGGTSLTVLDPCSPAADAVSAAATTTPTGALIAPSPADTWASLCALVRTGPDASLTVAHLTPPS